MAKLTINNYDEFAAYLGKNLGTSDYVELTGAHQHVCRCDTRPPVDTR